jgi:hypothetical protein
MDIIMVLALVMLVVVGTALMIRSDSPTWFLWPWRLHWAIWVILAVVWGLVLTLF